MVRRYLAALVLFACMIAPLGILGSPPVATATPLYTYTIIYYSDATYTTRVGGHIYNPCFPRQFTWGTTSPYYQETLSPCVSPYP